MTPSAPTAFENRLRKNARHLAKWARREGLTAYRVYDRDIPEYPYAVDRYGDRIHVSEFPRRKTLRDGQLEPLRAEVLAAIRSVLEVAPEHTYVKTHLRLAWGRQQHQKKGTAGERVVVEERGLRFWVNLGDYLDTGLFLDHRDTRARVRGEASGKRFLNLFAYTGSFTVYAAAGGASSTTSVDLSNTYLDWAADNLALNGVAGAHELIRADVLAWLDEAAGRARRFDLVVCDPPPFSTSAAMAKTLDVQRDHPALLRRVRELLAPGGVLYFSTNFRGFELSPKALVGLSGEELTPKSLPPDFQQRDVHRCWRWVRADEKVGSAGPSGRANP